MTINLGPSWFLDDGAHVTSRVIHEGCVESLWELEGEHGFTAWLIPEDGEEAIAEFPETLVGEPDRDLLVPGALFWFVVEIVRTPHTEGRSGLRFRRVTDPAGADGSLVEAARAAWFDQPARADSAVKD